ncbi:hypothetical protein V1511DRAFT_504131 [Dipodascopsis uninucleata]
MSSKADPENAAATGILLAAARAADPALTKANRILSNSSSLDLNLMTAQYVLSLLSSTLPMREKKSTLPTRLKTLSSKISDVRTFNRLWGLIAMLRWAIDTLERSPSDSILRLIAYSQVIVNTLYQVIENAAYLGSLNIVPISKRSIDRFWLISSRLFAAHVILEYIRLIRVRQVSAKELLMDKSAKELWWRQLIVNTAYFPLTIHWSSKGFLSDTVVGLLGTIAGGVRVVPLWQAK